MSDEQIDAIANDGHRNAAGGIYATSVHAFARGIEQAVLAASPAPAISESEDAARWIATSDRLPSSSDEVLVAVEFFGAGDWRIKVGYLGEEGGWHVFGGSWTPTHWMPLPEPPIDAARKGEKS
ncbi:DUF551 domain-containing protein [Burkholderia gladioli]|uniref:DUF551 domain-containing protein n=1 Tax=Burkholderia gladioli TaxID=28095 RepID=UPI000F7FC973|nr:DUF551 domain-containing protein [Burkholderia gladioli]